MNRRAVSCGLRRGGNFQNYRVGCGRRLCVLFGYGVQVRPTRGDLRLLDAVGHGNEWFNQTQGRKSVPAAVGLIDDADGFATHLEFDTGFLGEPVEVGFVQRHCENLSQSFGKR